MAAYQVWVCTMSICARSFICARFRARASTAVLNLASQPGGDLWSGLIAAHMQVALIELLRAPAVHLDLDQPGQLAA